MEKPLNPEPAVTSNPQPGAFLPVWPNAKAALAPWPVIIALAVILTIVGAASFGLIAAHFGFLAGFAAIIALAAGVAIGSDVRAGLWIALGISTLLPFAVIPFSVGMTLALLEATTIALIGVWLLRTFLLRDHLLPANATAALIVLLISTTLFAFLLGLGRGYTTQTYHDYVKFLLAMLLVFVVWTSIRTLEDSRRILTALLIGGAGSAVIGLLFQALGPAFAERVLSRLAVIGYPDQRIVRFIEDDPSRAMRLVSTSVDPNSVGGMLAIVFVIAAVQLFSRARIVPFWLCMAVVPLTGLAMLLTYSRGAWLGAAAGLGIAAILRYRWMIPLGLVMVPAALMAGPGRSLFERLWLGFTLQDPATRMRLDEYRNAVAIIREYPLFGVGFGDAPRVDLATGVSSIYLTVGQQTGFLGLVIYTAVLTAIGITGLRWWRSRQTQAEADFMLALLASFMAILVIGVFDHYFFNIQFPHMAAIFWIIAGLILANARPVMPDLREIG